MKIFIVSLLLVALSTSSHGGNFDEQLELAEQFVSIKRFILILSPLDMPITESLLDKTISLDD